MWMVAKSCTSWWLIPLSSGYFQCFIATFHTNESSRNSPVNPQSKHHQFPTIFPLSSRQPRRHFCYICYQAWPRWKNVGLTSLTSANIISFWEWLRIRFIGRTYHIYKAYFQGISPQNMARNMVLTYLHQLVPEMTIDHLVKSSQFSPVAGSNPVKDANIHRPGHKRCGETSGIKR